MIGLAQHSREIRQPRRCFVLAIVALIALSAAQLGCDSGNSAAVSFENRPIGTLADIPTLAERDDLNVLFIVIDTLRSDRLSSYGYERMTSPTLDYVAGTGIRFDQNRAQSTWTKTSMASLWTSLYPQRVDVLRYQDTVHPDARMPAEVFADAGFYTAGIWRNGWVAPNFGFEQGFNIYVTPKARQAPKAMRVKPVAGRINGTDIDAVYSATEFIRANQDRPFFLYVHLMDVHQYVSTAETSVFGTTYSDAYDNSILWEDQQVGEILAELYRLDMAKKTVVVIVSDHGEAFGEHGTEGHARDVHTEVTTTPFIIGLPFRLDPGAVVAHPTQNLDVFPTLYGLLGMKEQELTDGKSRVGWLLGDTTPDYPDRDYSFLDRSWGKASQDPDPVLAIRDGRYRIIHVVNDPERDRLYDVKSDEGEFKNIASSTPGVLKTLRSTAEQYFQLESPWEGGAPEIELDEMSLRQLRALGYSIED
jgi:arylsulfatase A-like enzyme